MLRTVHWGDDHTDDATTKPWVASEAKYDTARDIEAWARWTIDR